MTESFAELFEESLDRLEMTPGAIVSAEVLAIDNDFVTVNAGLKSEGVIAREQFLDDNGQLSIAVGDEVKVSLETVEDGYGVTRLSREKAKRAEAWAKLEQAFAAEETVVGTISQAVRGGFTVNLDKVQAFLPGSLLDIRPLRDSAHLMDKELQFKLVKLDEKRNNIVISRKAVLEAEYAGEREKLLESLAVGIVLKGIVKNLTDYGAFIDLGGLDGLLHITDMAWKRIKHPSLMLNVGDEIDVKVIRYDEAKGRVSLGLKQLSEDPWSSKIAQYPVGTQVSARVSNVMDYGCFAEIVEGVEGLVHMSEMDWTNKNVQPSKVVQLGDQINVEVLSIDKDRRRISLGMKQCQANPWQLFSENHIEGDIFSGSIRSITDFGLFIQLESGIDGLVHVSDLTWNESGESALKSYSKGDVVEVKILSIDLERERVALGIKQLKRDNFTEFCRSHQLGDAVSATVNSVTKKEVFLTLIDDITAIINVSLANHRHQEYKIGDTVNAYVAEIDKRKRVIELSTVQKSQDKESSSKNDKHTQLSGPTTIGELIKAQMKKDS